MATHSSILAWRIPRTEEPCELQSMGLAKSQTWLSDFHFSASSQDRFINTSFTLLTKTAKKKKTETKYMTQQFSSHQATKHSSFWKLENRRHEVYHCHISLRWETSQAVAQRGEPLNWGNGAESPGEAKQPGFTRWKPKSRATQRASPGDFRKAPEYSPEYWSHMRVTDDLSAESDLDLVSRRDSCWHRARNSTS